MQSAMLLEIMISITTRNEYMYSYGDTETIFSYD